MFDVDLSAFVRDARRFIDTFDTPISASTPHIYLSALPFSPPQSLVAKHYQLQFPNTLSVLSGLDQNWPAVVNIFQDYTEDVMSFAFSPDGKRVVSGSKDKTVCIWDAEIGQIVAGPFEGHMNGVNSVAFSPNGKWVVSGSDDKTIHIWDAETGQIITDPLKGHTNEVHSVAFSPDGKRVVSGSESEELRIRSLQTEPAKKISTILLLRQMP
jgi:WD40 repeat protein